MGAKLTCLMTVGIVGTGLIGTSIGMGLVAEGVTVLGVDPNKDALQVAQRRFGISVPAEIGDLRQCEVVFVTAPPRYCAQAVIDVLNVVSGETVVTDATSVKSEIVEAVKQKIGLMPNFVPGHPMAGHEKSGPEYASQWMFRGAKWLVTPHEGCSGSAIKKLEKVIALLGANPVRCGLEEHDRAVAVVSHLPHVFAALLVKYGAQLDSKDIGGGSWRDLTRVAGVDPDLWTQILTGNKKPVADLLRLAAADLESLAQSLDEASLSEPEKNRGVESFFRDAQTAKQAFAETPTFESKPNRRAKKSN